MNTERIEYKIYNFTTSSGEKIDELNLVYKTYGKLNEAKDNVIIFPTYYTGKDIDNERMIGTDKPIDPSKYFIIVPNMFGNGVSTSPSNTQRLLPNLAPSPLPNLSVLDNVLAQKQLLDSLGINGIKLAIGWSMGGMQVYQWISYFPQIISNAIIICSSAKTAIHNKVFLKGLKSIIDSDPKFNLLQNTDMTNALRTFGKVYAGWAYSQDFYREHSYQKLGFNSHDELLEDWAQDHESWDARDLYFMLNTWLDFDISHCEKYKQDINLALSSITAKVLLMPCNQDLYFRFDDSLIESQHLNNAEIYGYNSNFGHCSAGPGRVSEVMALIKTKISKLIESK